MEQKKHRRFYTIKFKLQVVDYAKQHGNRAAERKFGSPSTEKMIRTWRNQEDQLNASTYKKKKTCLRRGVVKWPDLEEELKTWVVDNRNSGIGVSTKMIMNHAREIARVRGINNFKGVRLG